MMRPSSAPLPRELIPAYRRCELLARRHYENFTVVSRLLPSSLRPHMAAIYAFCRGVDDIGDEFAGDRWAALDAYEAELRRCYSKATPTTPPFRALQETIRRFDLPPEPFLALLAANRQDQRVRRYRTFGELLAYCALSANPVGILVLALFGYRDPERQALSDATCTALQLTNFWQDVARDLAIGRLYIPLEDLAREGIEEAELMARPVGDPRVRRVIAFQVERTRQWFERGRALESMVPGRLALQLRLYRLGGEAVLEALARQGYDPFVARPALTGFDKLCIGIQALVPRRRGRRGGGHGR